MAFMGGSLWVIGITTFQVNGGRDAERQCRIGARHDPDGVASDSLKQGMADAAPGLGG